MSYGKFKKYAKHFSEHYWGDYVHNIWLRYWDKHGKDIFQESWSNRQIFKIVQREFLNSLYKYDRFDDIIKVDEETQVGSEYIPSDEPSELDHLVAAGLDHWVKDRIKLFVFDHYKRYEKFNSNYARGNEMNRVKEKTAEEYLKKILLVYEYVKVGETPTTIGELMGETKGRISIFKKQIREAIMGVDIKNPFNGSKIKVTGHVSSKTWEAGKKFSHADYEEEDRNEFYALMVHTESKEGLLVNLPEDKSKHNQYVKRMVDADLTYIPPAPIIN